VSTRPRMVAAIEAGVPSMRRAPATSMNASSIDNCSTSGDTDRQDPPVTSRLFSTYRAMRGVRKTACGHAFRARAIGMAERTPKRRAS